MKFLLRSNSGFTLVEALMSSVIASIAGLGVIAAVIYTRQMMELDKQRMAALNVCRQYIEHANALNSLTTGTVDLVQFAYPNVPELQAEVKLDYFPISLSDGSIDWNNRFDTPSNTIPCYCRVTVSWIHRRTKDNDEPTKYVRMGTIVRKNLGVN